MDRSKIFDQFVESLKSLLGVTSEPVITNESEPEALVVSESLVEGTEANAPMLGEVIQTTEAQSKSGGKFLDSDGRGLIKVIGPGQGSSAYYPTETLKQFGPKVFTKGMHMYWDHQTRQQEKDKPEGSLRDLAAVLEGDAEWKDDGPKGAGLYAPIKAFSGFKRAINEIGGHIGTSIRAFGQAVKGTVNERKTYIMQSFDGAKSIDFVTRAGRGGSIIETFESAGREAREVRVDEVEVDEAVSRHEDDKENVMTEQEKTAVLQRLDSLEADKKKLEGQLSNLQQVNTLLVTREAARTLYTSLTEKVSPPIRKKVAESGIFQNLPLNENFGLDEAKFKDTVESTVKAEEAFLAQYLGGTGRIVGATSHEAAPSEEDRKVQEANSKRLEQNRKAFFGNGTYNTKEVN